jgi:nucleoside-triphosphatase THEP1
LSYVIVRKEGVRHRSVVDYVSEKVVRYVGVVIVDVRIEQVKIGVCVNQVQVCDERCLAVEFVQHCQVGKERIRHVEIVQDRHRRRIRPNGILKLIPSDVLVGRSACQ